MLPVPHCRTARLQGRRSHTCTSTCCPASSATLSRTTRSTTPSTTPAGRKRRTGAGCMAATTCLFTLHCRVPQLKRAGHHLTRVALERCASVAARPGRDQTCRCPAAHRAAQPLNLDAERQPRTPEQMARRGCGAQAAVSGPIACLLMAQTLQQDTGGICRRQYGTSVAAGYRTSAAAARQLPP